MIYDEFRAASVCRKACMKPKKRSSKLREARSSARNAQFKAV